MYIKNILSSIKIGCFTDIFVKSSIYQKKKKNCKKINNSKTIEIKYKIWCIAILYTITCRISKQTNKQKYTGYSIKNN